MGSEERKKNKRMKKSNGEREKKSDMITDDRFASAQTDPRFVQPPKRRSKVEIDSRFSGLFTKSSFNSSNAPVDKRGKPKNNKKGSATALSHYYSLERQEKGNKASRIGKREDDESLADGSDLVGLQTESEKLNEALEDDDDDDDESLAAGSEKLNEALEEDDDDDDVHSLDESSAASTTDTDTDTDTDSDDQYLHVGEEDTFMPQEDNIPEIEEETRRLAVVNLDWSQVRAVDLYVLLSSFLPKGGQVLSVSVYPSEFGVQRMAEEAVRGPVGLFDDEGESDDGDDDEIDNKKLRAYELSRLRYYYAVVECDSIATADYLYKTCDGVEFERSANKLDLRFIPDSLEFKHQPRDVATEAPANYEGADFETRALQQSNIRLTWDEDEPQRAKTLKRKFNDEQIAEMELKEFLASDDSDESDDDEVEDKSARKGEKQDKYRALIQSGDGSDEDGEDEDEGQDMEVTFNTGLEDISQRILEKKNKKSETVWDAYLRKRKEKKKASKKGSKYSSEDESSDTDQEPAEDADDFFVEEPENKSNPIPVKGKKTNKSTTQEMEASRAELELLTADDKGEDAANLKGYNLKPKKKSRGKKDKSIPDEEKLPTVDYEDPRFAPLFTSPHYALDPTDPQFKRSATYARQITQKKKTSTRRRD